MPHIPASGGRPPWRAAVITLFPGMFPGPLGFSLPGQALAAGLWTLETIPLRDFGIGRHRQVDDTPAGGGPGMVLRADVLAAALDQGLGDNPGLPAICLSPRGEPLRQDIVRELAGGPGVLLVAARFEGVDERVIVARRLREISIGDYVLMGGELAAMVLIEAAVRLVPGVLGSAESPAAESFERGLLEYPQYTRPREWEGLTIPDVLLSGDHRKIAAWREAESWRITQERRPDLAAKVRRRSPHG